MVESLQELEKLQKQRELQEETIAAYKEQVGKLKVLLAECTNDNERLTRENAATAGREEDLRNEVIELQKLLHTAEDKTQRLASEKDMQAILIRQLQLKLSVPYYLSF